VKFGNRRPATPVAFVGMDAGPLIWHRSPDSLDRSQPAVCLAAFEGWNDAGEAASGTVRRLAEHWNAVPLASIDPEEFVDFSSTRPSVERIAGNRVIKWPATEILLGLLPSGQPALFIIGPEPQLRWRTYCSIIGQVLEAVGVNFVMLLGGLLTDVPHTRPTRITRTTSTIPLAERFGFSVSKYEGPTGIVGVFADACQQFSIDAVSFWASVPHYLPGSQAPRAALALIEAVGDFFEFPLSPIELHVEASEFDRQINEVVEADEDMRRYVDQLEERFDSGDDELDDDEDIVLIDDEEDDALSPDDFVANGKLIDESGKPLSGDALAAELEQFLRERDS
jgi:proteasome assembly chaperone (PAC2) family protein